MISAIELIDLLHQPCLVIEATKLHIQFVNRSMASTVGLTPRKFLRQYKALPDLFPWSAEKLIQSLKEVQKSGSESNTQELVEEIEGTLVTFVARFIIGEENAIILILNNLSVEKKLQEKYGILQKSLTAYTQRMKSDLEFKDFIVDRLPKLLTAELGLASRTLLKMKEDVSRREDLSGLQKVKSIAGSLDQMLYMSKNISQLRSPFKIERKDIQVGELSKFLQNFFWRSFDSGLNSILVTSLPKDNDENCFLDPNLLAFCMRNLFAFLQNKGIDTEQLSTLSMKLVSRENSTLLEFTGKVETSESKKQEANSQRELGLELIVANKLAKALGGHLSFSEVSVNCFQLSLPASGNFVLHKLKPNYDKIFFYGPNTNLPKSLGEFLDIENLKINVVNHLDDLLMEKHSALIIGAGVLTRNLVAKLARFNGTSINIIPIVSADSSDQLLYALEELDVTKFLFEPITLDGLRSVFFEESDIHGFIFSSKD
jgi:hypothetical protein